MFLTFVLITVLILVFSGVFVFKFTHNMEGKYLDKLNAFAKSQQLSLPKKNDQFYDLYDNVFKAFVEDEVELLYLIRNDLSGDTLRNEVRSGKSVTTQYYKHWLQISFHSDSEERLNHIQEKIEHQYAFLRDNWQLAARFRKPELLISREQHAVLAKIQVPIYTDGTWASFEKVLSELIDEWEKNRP